MNQPERVAADGIHVRIDDGDRSSGRDHCLDRIAAVDDAGPRLNAVIEINPEETPLTAHASFPLRGPAGVILPATRQGILTAMIWQYYKHFLRR